MAKRTCIFFISIFLMAGGRAVSQDTVTVPLHLRAGFDLSGPLMKLINNELISYGVLTSADVNSALTLSAGIRYSSFHREQHNYDFSSHGTSIVAGADYNFIKAKTSEGRYYAGIGLRYGISIYREEAPMIKYTNEWGAGESGLPVSHHAGHFLEITPGVRTELLPGLTIGWNLYMRLLISAGAGKDLKPVWMPGYGAATSGMTTGAAYYISLSIPYKKIKVIIKPRTPETEGEDEGESGDVNSVTQNFSSGSSGRL
jgi:hypothetical protein